MPTPVAITSRTLYAGACWDDLTFTLEYNAAPLDLSAAGVTVQLRFRRRGDDTIVTRTTGQAGETSWVSDGTDGGVTFLFDASATAVMTPGTYDVEIVYEDTNTSPATKRMHATGTWVVKRPSTGAI